ncbi:MAG: hypothetical protein JSR82_17680 [Verrucomicrobia bacterium]|nr:hypothetical protein [Verrucomicrobiota bacterium]
MKRLLALLSKWTSPQNSLIPSLPPAGVRPPAHFQPAYEVRLSPTKEPTLDQIRYIREQFPHIGNFLDIRKTLIEGGLGFGPALEEKIKILSLELSRLDLTFELYPSRAWFDTRNESFTYQWHMEP